MLISLEGFFVAFLILVVLYFHPQTTSDKADKEKVMVLLSQTKKAVTNRKPLFDIFLTIFVLG